MLEHEHGTRSRYVEQTQTTRPAQAPINLEVKQVDALHLVALGGIALGALCLAGGAAALLFVAPAAALLWLMVVVGSVVLAALLFWLISSEVQARIRHNAMIMEWHAVMMEAHHNAGGIETETHTSAWELHADNPAHVLIAAIILHNRVASGESLSVRACEGAMFLHGRRIGDLTRGGAASMLNRLAAMGLIEGRSPRSAGEWVAKSESEIVETIMQKWR